MTIGSASHLTRRSLLATATMSAFGLIVPLAFAQARFDEGPIAATVENLRPGQFLWAPEAAPEGPVIIVVSLSKQRAYVYRNGVLIGTSTISQVPPAMRRRPGFSRSCKEGRSQIEPLR